MERFTQIDTSNTYYVNSSDITTCENGYAGNAIERLAKFENMYMHLHQEQQKIAANMDKLKQEGKEKTARFKELFGKKLINSSLLAMYQVNGL